MLWAGGRGAGGYPEISKFFENAKSFLRTRNPISVSGPGWNDAPPPPLPDCPRSQTARRERRGAFGGSVMEAYVRFCDGTHEVRNLRQTVRFLRDDGNPQARPDPEIPRFPTGAARPAGRRPVLAFPSGRRAPLTLIPGTRKKSLSPPLNFHQNRRMLWAGGRGAGGYPEISKFFENAKSFLRTRNPNMSFRARLERRRTVGPVPLSLSTVRLE